MSTPARADDATIGAWTSRSALGLSCPVCRPESAFADAVEFYPDDRDEAVF